MKKFVLCGIATTLVMMLLSSCSLFSLIPSIDNTTPWQELCTQEVDIEKFTASFEDIFRNESTDGYALEEVAKNLPIQCLRSPREGVWYSVHRVKQGGLLYCFYHSFYPEDTKYLLSYYWIFDKMSSEECPEIQAGMTLSEVEALLPQTRLCKAKRSAYPDTSLQYDFSKIDGDIYLSDGLFCIGFQETEGNLTVKNTCFRQGHSMGLTTMGRHYHYNGEILPLDWPE